MISTLWYLKSKLFSFVFWENWRHQKDIFNEINWPLKALSDQNRDDKNINLLFKTSKTLPLLSDLAGIMAPPLLLIPLSPSLGALANAERMVRSGNAAWFLCRDMSDLDDVDVKFVTGSRLGGTRAELFWFPRDSNEWDAKESNFSLWFANTSHTY